jgi:hypothetical protein
MLRAEAKAPAEVLATLSADREFSSADGVLRAARPAATEIPSGLGGRANGPPPSRGGSSDNGSQGSGPVPPSGVRTRSVKSQ